MTATDLDRRRTRFGERLRRLRERAGFVTGTAFAARLGWQQSRVSRIETGAQLATDADLITWLAAVDAREPIAASMRTELLELRLQSASWKRQLRTGNRRRQEHAASIEDASSRIRAFETALVPGLVQTAEYAEHVFATNAEFYRSPADIDESVRVRMERQRVLYDRSKTIELVMTEAALHYPVCPPEVLAAQLDRLIAVAGLSSVTFGIIPLGTRLPVVPMHGFWILDGQAIIETIDTEITVTEPEDVALYSRMADAMVSVATVGSAARTILLRLIDEIGTR
ncbi:MAG: helix-turn-helix domain-containing protein [Kutzneria sp.]|nr:helix-turn-helix domain-containing protein [Kutzneria sp.]MBV9847317.1 helix-turn-helix domain-containing protein [Kutzneria sp.]